MKYKGFVVALLAMLGGMATEALAQVVSSVNQLNKTTVEVVYEDGKQMTIDFYGDNIFRLFRDDEGGILRAPEATPPAKILVDNPRRPLQAGLQIERTGDQFLVKTVSAVVSINRQTGLMEVKTQGQDGTSSVLQQTAPVTFKRGAYELTFRAQPDEYFFGGGVQNGRFSHRGKKIEIVNTNSWTDGGVCSPAPFYWSTAGYGVLCNTFTPGAYDFAADRPSEVLLTHDSPYLDMFVMIDNTPVALLNDYYQLTGNPVLLPEFAFYEGHLNAYNRDYWKETDDQQRGILFEDGKYYTESQTDNGGIRESLNGELDGNYQFSGRAVIDRYNAYDMPLGWVLPNDGYGAGYGQTETLDGNIQNLKAFGDYARQKGVEIGLWTQSNLHPVPDVSALLQRDIVKEVRDAGVRVLKTDVAWVGAGYSFGLNGIADVAQIMPYYGNEARPFIISLNGWAGTQRYAGIWTGDQTGGEWEYIRFHIPTYIGAGLSGMSNITSDMDGIFGGKNVPVNVRDFQWKTFTPMQLNMDGWGSNPKYPQQLGEPATSINRTYLKWKSILLPYTYSAAYEAVTGKPLIRAMFLDEPLGTPSSTLNYTLGTRTQYQYLYGPYFLIAPIYQETKADAQGNDIRNNIYLPAGTWIDFVTGEAYEGGRIINSFDAPLWKLPVFVKQGAIIPENTPNNNPTQIDRKTRIYELYPSTERTSFTEYADDGTTDAYLGGAYAMTEIEQQVEKGRAHVIVHPAVGEYKGMEKEKTTVFKVNLTKQPKRVTVWVNGKKVALAEEPVYEAPELNCFATPGSPFASFSVKKNPVLTVKVPATSVYNKVELWVDGYEYAPADRLLTRKGALAAPALNAHLSTPYTLTPTWQPVGNADYYEVEFEGMTYSTIRDTQLLFEGLQPETDYAFKVRAVNSEGASDWTTLNAHTDANPLEFALHGLTAECTAADQAGFGLDRLFDFAEKGDIWHTDYQNREAAPFDLTIDLHCTATLDRLQYLPRENAGNGTILHGHACVSTDQKNWTDVGEFTWARDAKAKEIVFAPQTEVRYIKLSVDKTVGGFGSGTEIYVFKKPGTKVLIPGDINQDGKVDENDLTSYLNYTGLRQGDSDFEGYVSKGDINGNGLIDAYDISVVATQLEDAQPVAASQPSGVLTVKADKQVYQAGDDVLLTVSGKDLANVNALQIILPYAEADMQFVSIEPKAVGGMSNMTNDRLHRDGSKVLYPTFVNVGDKPALNGDGDLFVIRMKANRRFTLKPVATKGMLVSRGLATLEF